MANLYPPILPDTMPAFVASTGSCRIYFALSDYNSIDEINAKIQISVSNQKDNKSVLKNPSEIKIINFSKDSSIQTDYCYYIDILSSYLIDESFKSNQLYKVQMRFMDQNLFVSNNEEDLNNLWLENNKNYFSEWSKICLIKSISAPQVHITGFDETTKETVFNSSLFSINGYLSFGKNETQYLKSYNIKIYPEGDSSNIAFDSGEVYTNYHNPNEFNYDLNTELLDGVNYVLKFTYSTSNSYTSYTKYTFIILTYSFDKIDAKIEVVPNQQKACMEIYVTGTNNQPFMGNLTIRRTSSKSNFHKWDDIKNISYLSNNQLNFVQYDYTIESGVWYKYCVQKRNIFGDRGIIIQTEKPAICIFDDIFLVADNKQLKIMFNPSLNSFKYNVIESQQNTIGSKYPFIKRNNANYFRTFSIGGLISSLSDMSDWYDPHYKDNLDEDLDSSKNFDKDKNELKLFTSKKDIYEDSFNLYNDFNSQNNITEYDDYVYEREFRQKVYDFLYKNNVKLFKSTTEGNILIKLMNIDFQPMETLGRRLYSFTATAVEIDEATLKNYDKYNIQNIGTHESEIIYSEDKFGQIQITGKIDDIIQFIENRQSQKITNTQRKVKVNFLKYLKLEIESEPYIISQQDGELQQYIMQAATTSSPINPVSGYLIKINNHPIIIYPQMQRQGYDNLSKREITSLGFFELKNENTNIRSLSIPYPITATLTYIANVSQQQTREKVVGNYYYYKRIGQLYGVLPTNINLVRTIKNRYLESYKKYYQKVINIPSIEIEAPPGTIVYIKDSKDYSHESESKESYFNKHIIQNGYLKLKDDNASIVGLYFYGIQLKKVQNDKDISFRPKFLRPNEYFETSESYATSAEIENPVQGYVYNIDKILTEENEEGTTVENNEGFYEDINGNLVLQVGQSSYESLSNEDDVSYYLLLSQINNNKQYQMPIDDSFVEDNEGFEEDPLTESLVLKVGSNSYESYEVINDFYYILLLSRLRSEASQQNRYIYHNENWYPMIGDVAVRPVEGLINYYYELTKGVYR